MDGSAWSAPQLAEFILAVSTADAESTAARAVVERAAEALDADVAAIVAEELVVAAVGYTGGSVPVAELASVSPGAAQRRLDVPGVGACSAAAAALEHPPGAVLVVGRQDALTREECGLLYAMARIASMTMRMLRVLADERAAREELERLAREQAALRRVATLVAEAGSPDAIFAAVAEEVGRLLPADSTFLTRYDPEHSATVVGAWSSAADGLPSGHHESVERRDVSTRVLVTGRPARVDPSGDGAGGEPAGPLATGGRSRLGVPITVAGRLWGVMIVASGPGEPLPPDTETHLAGFIELVATAIANAEAHAELTASRARIVATADETRRRIERDLHDGAQQRLVSLALQLRAAQAAVPRELAGVAAKVDRVAAGLTDALEELREIARGIHPAVLADGGLVPALRSLGRRSSVPVALDVRTSARLEERIEITAYYVVCEALTNVTKHAQSSIVHVEVDAADGVLRLTIRDEGVGGADPARGSGLVGLKDRVAATGGRMILDSPPGEGTCLVVELPVRARAPQRAT